MSEPIRPAAIRAPGSGSTTSSSNPGSASPAVQAQNTGQTVWVASHPDAPPNNVRPIAISEVSSANCVPLNAPRESDEK